MAEQEQGQGSEKPSILKRPRNLLPGGSERSKVMRTEAALESDSGSMTANLQALLAGLRYALSRLQERETEIKADAADQLQQVKELYVAIVRVIVRKWAICDDSPESIRNKTITIKKVELTNEGHARIDQTSDFFEKHGFEEDPAYAIDRATVLYMAKRKYLLGSGIDVDEQVKSFLEEQRKTFQLDVSKDKATCATEYIEQYITKKGKIYGEITSIHDFLDELNLLMVPKRSHRNFEGLQKEELVQELESAYADLARCHALKSLPAHLTLGNEGKNLSRPFHELKKLGLITLQPAEYAKSRYKTYQSLLTYLDKVAKNGSESTTDIAEKAAIDVEKKAHLFRVVANDVKDAISEIGEKATTKAKRSGNSPGLGRA